MSLGIKTLLPGEITDIFLGGCIISGSLFNANMRCMGADVKFYANFEPI